MYVRQQDKFSGILPGDYGAGRLLSPFPFSFSDFGGVGGDLAPPGDLEPDPDPEPDPNGEPDPLDPEPDPDPEPEPPAPPAPAPVSDFQWPTTPEAGSQEEQLQAFAADPIGFLNSFAERIRQDTRNMLVAQSVTQAHVQQARAQAPDLFDSYANPISTVLPQLPPNLQGTKGGVTAALFLAMGEEAVKTGDPVAVLEKAYRLAKGGSNAPVSPPSAPALRPSQRTPSSGGAGGTPPPARRSGDPAGETFKELFGLGDFDMAQARPALNRGGSR